MNRTALLANAASRSLRGADVRLCSAQGQGSLLGCFASQYSCSYAGFGWQQLTTQ